MKILGIETSCDETAASIINGEKILSEKVYTQDIHSAYGGVVPELASRDHIKKLSPMVRSVLNDAKITVKNLDGVAVSSTPGLPGALLVGLSFAKGLASAARIPVVMVNHLEGHIFATKFAGNAKPPFITLLVSGGHTEIVRVDEWGKYFLLGSTRDDAAGEAFDKVAFALGLPYPGGPQIQKLAQKGNPVAIKFPRAMQKSDDMDYSFSGLKTAVLNLLDDWGKEKVKKNLSDIAASFQEAVVDALLQKLQLAIQCTGLETVAIVGGVAANERLRQKAKTICSNLIIPPVKYCTDNATMIAMAGHFHLARGEMNPVEFIHK